MIGLEHYLVLSAILFIIGVMGVLTRRNIIVILLSIELILAAVNLNMIAFSSFLHNATGQVFVFFVLTVAAAEAALGLAILVNLFKNLESINVDDVNHLKG